MGVKRTRRRKRKSSYGLQLVGATVLVALAAWMLFAFVEKAIHPYWLQHTVGRDVSVLREKIATQKARNANLRAQIAYAQSEEGAEALARRAGFSRPGEQVYFLQRKPVQDGGERGR